MRKSWRPFFRRMASVLFVGGATAWSSAVAYAQTIASDNSLNSPYNDGWQVGDNGGFGFTPWNFDNDTLFEVKGIHDIDGLNPNPPSTFNQLGRAWRLGLEYLDDPNGHDIVRAGRGLAAPLAIGQTVSIVVDGPTAHRGIGGGYFIRL